MVELITNGWRKDRFDRRDYIHKPRLVPKEVPDITTWLQFLVNIRNQGDEGSCVGFGIGGSLSSVLKKLGLFKEWFSPRDIYNGGKAIGGYLNEEGAYPRDAYEWVRLKGCLLESKWPYVANKDWNKMPPGSLDTERAKYPILAYYRVDNGIDGICSAIADGHFVSIGSIWFDKWMETDANGNLAAVKSSDHVAGGHEYYLYGYDKKTQKFLCANSWDTNWGKKGMFTLPFQAIDIFKQVEGYDAHYVDVKWGTQPEPTPVPVSNLYNIKGQVELEVIR